MAESGTPIRVEVACALPDRQEIVSLEVAMGTTVRQAVERSGILSRFPEVEFSAGNVGLFGRLTAPDAPLRDGDRVEIYRPLAADPKQARRARVKRRK